MVYTIPAMLLEVLVNVSMPFTQVRIVWEFWPLDYKFTSIARAVKVSQTGEIQRSLSCTVVPDDEKSVLVCGFLGDELG